MIASLEGVLAHKGSSGARINVGGVGYYCQMSTSSLMSLGTEGSPVYVETLLLFKNDALALYGFASAEERSLFESLTSVSGVGAKFALAILSTYSPSELTKIIQSSDATRLTAVSGIGKKTAQRIILELQGSLDSLTAMGAEPDAGSERAEVVLALESMGFSSSEIALALSGDAADDLAEGTPASEMIRLALKRLV